MGMIQLSEHKGTVLLCHNSEHNRTTLVSPLLKHKKTDATQHSLLTSTILETYPTKTETRTFVEVSADTRKVSFATTISHAVFCSL